MEKLHYNPAISCCSAEDTGDLFPDLLCLAPNCINRGRVFSIHLVSHGLGQSKRQLDVDHEAWDRCFSSPGFERSYRLSMAKLALQQALY